MSRTWSDDIAVTPTGDGRFTAHVGPAWAALQGVHGGVVAAIASNAVQQVLVGLGADATTALRSATFGYVRGNVEGDLTVEVDVVRQGRALVTSQVTVSQDGRTTTVGRLHHSTPWDGPAYSDAPAPPVRPADAVGLEGARAAHLANVETWLHPATTPFAGAPRAEWVAWCRPLHGPTFDATWLTMFGDYFPPAVFARLTAPNRAVTIEYSIQLHTAASSWTLADGEYLAARVHTFHSRDGFAVEDGFVWHPDGTLLATVRQTRLAG